MIHVKVIARYSGFVLKRRIKKPAVGVMTAAPSMYAVASHWTVETPMLKSAMMLVKPTLRNVSLNVAINAASATANIMDSSRFSAA